MSSASVTCSLTTWAPWTSIFRITSSARYESIADLVPRRAVPVAVDLVGFEEAPLGANARGTRPTQEVVVDAVDLAVARRPGRARHDVVTLAIAAGLALPSTKGVDDRVLPDARWARR